jgi:tetratricopeptide (TPR) repeat protein
MRASAALSIMLCTLLAFSNGFSQTEKKPQESLSVSVPGKSWAVQIDTPGFSIEQDTVQQGRRYLMASDDKSGVVLSVTLERVNGKAEMDECRSSLQKRAAGGQSKMDNVRTPEFNEIPIVEYSIPLTQGIQQGNLFACVVNEDVYIDIHLSKLQFQEKDEPLFESVLKNMHIVQAGANASPGNAGSARQLFLDGTRAYVKGDFASAIPPYRQAFDLEKKQRTLDQTTTRVLIDNLGMAYGITGDLSKASDVFNYGVSIDPNYPLFYYNIACVYGEKDDADNAILFLQKAFANKANVISGEKMPDPRTDDSFARLMKNDRFSKAVTVLMQAGQ